MERKTWFEKMLDSVKDSFEFRLETIILNLTEQICKRMKGKGIKKTQLAEKLHVSPAAVSKILNGNPNFTIKTLLLLADTLNLGLEIKFVDNTESARVQAYAQAKVMITSTDDFPNIPFWAPGTASSTERPTRPAELQIN